MIELAMAALVETAEYEEEALRLAVHYNCEAHHIPGRSFTDATLVSRERFLAMGYAEADVETAINQIIEIYTAQPAETSSAQFCLDMFELMYPADE